MTRGDWSRLPDDLLRRVVENYMETVEDYVIFSCVCQSWYLFARGFDKSDLRKKWTRQMPLLMLTDGNTEIYDIMKKRIRSYNVYKSAKPKEDDERRIFNVKDYVKDYEFETNRHYIQCYHHSDEDEDNDNDNNNNGEETNAIRCMLKLSGRKKKCYRASLPEAYGRSCWGSRYGWIVTLGCDRQMCLLNPFTKSTLPLPSQWTFRYHWKQSSGKTIRWTFIDKAVLLLLPRENGCHNHSHISHDSPCSATGYNNGIWLVVVLHHDILVSIAKPGDSSWTPILRPSRRNRNFTNLIDVTYCARLRSLLFIDIDMKVFICDLSDIEHPQVLKPYFQGRENQMNIPAVLCDKFYFVESGGETLIISRYMLEADYHCYPGIKIGDYGEFESHLTFNFRVHMIEFETKELKEIYDLGNVALFVGANATFSVCSTKVGCEANCVYFCDDHQDRPFNRYNGHDMGMFKMDDRTVRPFYDGHRSHSSYCCPFWFIPSL